MSFENFLSHLIDVDITCIQLQKVQIGYLWLDTHVLVNLDILRMSRFCSQLMLVSAAVSKSEYEDTFICHFYYWYKVYIHVSASVKNIYKI